MCNGFTTPIFDNKTHYHLDFIQKIFCSATVVNSTLTILPVPI